MTDALMDINESFEGRRVWSGWESRHNAPGQSGPETMTSGPVVAQQVELEATEPAIDEPEELSA